MFRIGEQTLASEKRSSLNNAMITVVILTRDEERHINRAIQSVSSIASRIYVVDSGSNDQTVEIATSMGARVLFNPWTNHAAQFNWALDQLPQDTDWVLKLDADEIVSPRLVSELSAKLGDLPPEVGGVSVSRRMNFLGQRVRWGGVFPIRLVRIFRHGRGRSESRWMDEHIVVSGEVVGFRGEIVDDNLKSLSWWTAKHNAYASREVIELLNLEYCFMEPSATATMHSGPHAGLRRWMKERIYAQLPIGMRAFCYFFYRYVLRLGFLDGREGAAFHILQGFWYRYLVDMKLHEVKRRMNEHEVDVIQAIRDVLAVDLRRSAHCTDEAR